MGQAQAVPHLVRGELADAGERELHRIVRRAACPVLSAPASPSKIRRSWRTRSEPRVTCPLRISPVRGSIMPPPYDQPRVERWTHWTTL